MVGCFGLKDDHHHDHVALQRLVSQHASVSVHDLDRQGLLTVGAQAHIQTPHGGYLAAIRQPGILDLDGQQILLGWHPSLPLHVVICPRCQGDRYKLYRVGGVWACQRCHSLTWASRHRFRTIGRLNRVRWLRQRIGADLRPFTPLPVKPLSARRYWALVREIRRLEAGLVEHAARDVAAVLERRHAKRS